jgi:CRP-like cAMP-binding protein
MHQSPQEVLRDLPVFAVVPEPILTRLGRASDLRRVAKGQTVFLQGERATAIRFVCDGWVKLYRICNDGAEAAVRLMPRAHSLEEMAALRGANHYMTAQAVTGARILSVDARALRDAMAEDSRLNAALRDMAARNLGRILGDAGAERARSAPQRLAGFLLDHSPEDHGRVDIRLQAGCTGLAARLHLGPDMLRLAFARLRPLGVVMTGGVVRVADVERLAEFAAGVPVPRRLHA